MKTFSKISMALVLLAGISFTACNKDEEEIVMEEPIQPLPPTAEQPLPPMVTPHQ
ncbi:hypothetical protein [Saccharicrinis aurantiacus]|uniref:hypothetical protein n=1 Tax=Saccharicrinis aurantiacus TaxID=1849719 RepID=UPI002492D35E|nr:hypothetical protein [Saccharicrinis aurantiacus]